MRYFRTEWKSNSLKSHWHSSSYQNCACINPDSCGSSESYFAEFVRYTHHWCFNLFDNKNKKYKFCPGIANLNIFVHASCPCCRMDFHESQHTSLVFWFRAISILFAEFFTGLLQTIKMTRGFVIANSTPNVGIIQVMVFM